MSDAVKVTLIALTVVLFGLAMWLVASRPVEPSPYTDLGNGLYVRCDGTTAIYSNRRGISAVPHDSRCP